MENFDWGVSIRIETCGISIQLTFLKWITLTFDTINRVHRILWKSTEKLVHLVLILKSRITTEALQEVTNFFHIEILVSISESMQCLQFFRPSDSTYGRRQPVNCLKIVDRVLLRPQFSYLRRRG